MKDRADKTSKDMMAWDRATDESGLVKAATPATASLLYRLTIAFPSWAGAILALYALFMSKSTALRIRLR